MGHIILQSLFIFLKLLYLFHKQLNLFTRFTILVKLILESFQGSVDSQVFTEVYLIVSHATTVTGASHFLAGINVWFSQGIHEVDIFSIVFKYLEIFLIGADGFERNGGLWFILGDWLR